MPRRQNKSPTVGTPTSTTKQSSTPTQAPVEKRVTIVHESSGKPITGGSQLVTGSSQLVLVLLVVLLLFVSWKDLIVPLSDLTWNKDSKNNMTSLPWSNYLGAIVFIIIAVFLASISDDIAGLILLMVFGLYAIYIIENKGGGIIQLLDFLTGLSNKKSK